MEKNFNILEILVQGWEILKKNWVQVVIVSIIAGVINVVTSKIGEKLIIEGNLAAYIIVSTIVSVIVTIAYMKLMFQILDGEQIKYMNIFKVKGKVFFKVLVTTILYGIIYLMILPILVLILYLFISYAFAELSKSSLMGPAMFLSSMVFPPGTGLLEILIIIFLVIAIIGFFLLYKYKYALFLLIDKDLGIGEAFKKSSETTKNIRFKLFLLDIVAILFTIVGIVCLIIPGILALYSFSIGKMYLYRKLYLTTYPELACEEAVIGDDPQYNI